MRKNESGHASVVMVVLRLLCFLLFAGAFIPALNPARLSELIGENVSLFTCALSYSSIASEFTRALQRGWVEKSAISTAYTGAVLAALGIAGSMGVFCVSLGKLKMKRLSAAIGIGAGVLGLSSTAVLLNAASMFTNSPNPDRIDPMMPVGVWVFAAVFAVQIILCVIALMFLPKPTAEDRYEIEARYRLFLMMLPFLALVLIFSYLPLWGWRVSLFDYRPGFKLSMDSFVGLKWLRYLFDNAATRADIMRVLRNTFAISGIGIATSWLPMAFAIFLSEMRSNGAKRFVQTLTTIPNFISWVLVYSVAFAIFSTEGFLNWLLTSVGIIEAGTNYLMNGSHIWLKMWAWGTWKGLGWGAIIYIAGISGIDQQLYEAATVDGAGRFQKMWHITVPGLLSTFFVLLLLSISNILSNGMDQYLVFHNPINKDSIQVLDLYVYQLGLGAGGGSTSNISLATLVGMLKSIISVTLLFGANKVSKWLRGESIV
ncbi:MAG: ABC transporter permease subunit [Clostridiales bacterium]|jgi:putative aldouronate transport system permease protein|nr:ABC transporter permease subunit [Clostridiales bacterium]